MNLRPECATRTGPVPVLYEKIEIHTAFYADLVVEDQVIVEIKAVETIAPVHKRQLLTYLELADKLLGLLINFHVYLIKRNHPHRQRTPRMIAIEVLVEFLLGVLGGCLCVFA